MSCGSSPFNSATASLGRVSTQCIPGTQPCAQEASCEDVNTPAACNLTIGVESHPREAGENLYCYYLRLFETLFEGGGTGVLSVTASGPLSSSGGATPNITLSGIVPVVNGGTGSSDAAGARSALGAAASGANTDISSLAPDYIDFDTAANPAGAVGRVLWRDSEGGLEYQMKGGQVTLQIGQELVKRVYNNSGVPLTDGQIVRVTGSQGQRLTVALAQANNEANSTGVLGMVTEPIANGAEGFVTIIGIVNNVNTQTLADGAELWLSAVTPGGYATTQPTAPNHAVRIGYVVKGGSVGGGSIFIKATENEQLRNLHDVSVSSVANNDLLVYDSALTVWRNRPISYVSSALGLGSMAYQASNSVAISGGSIDGVTIGGTTRAAGSFTTLALTVPLSVSNGGTGALSAGAARSNLGLGSIATQAANSVILSGGTIDGVTIGGTTRAAGSFTTLTLTNALSITNGGTGATDAVSARGNLGLGSIATQAASSVSLSGGSIDGVTVGAGSPASGAFTTLKASGLVGLGGITLASAGVYISSSLSAAAGNIFGVVNNASLAATGNGVSFIRQYLGSAATFSKGTSTGLNLFGLYLDNPNITGTGTLDNHYALYINTPSGATNNYSIYSAGGNNVLAGGLNSTPIGLLSPSTGVFTTLAISGGLLTVQRGDALLEGGQLDLYRASDNTIGWSIDAYGAGATPTLRFINPNGVQLSLSGAGLLSGVDASFSTISATGAGFGSVNASTVTATLATLDRNDTLLEGGQVNLNRALDNAVGWSIDAYGAGATPLLRFFNSGGVHFELTGNGTLTTSNGIETNGKFRSFGANGGYVITRRDTNADAWEWYSAAGSLLLYQAATGTNRAEFTTSGFYVNGSGEFTGGLVNLPSLSTASKAATRSIKASLDIEVNVKDYGAAGNGTTDDSTAIAAAVAAIATDGPIFGLKLLTPITGFAIPDPNPVIAWAARPAVAAVGGLGSGFSAVGNIGPAGIMTGFEITNPGSNYAVLAISVNRTNGTNTITKADGTAFDARLVAGVSVRHESLNNGVTITARSIDGLTLTISQNNTFTNTDTFVFGLPWFTVAGTPYYDDISPVIGPRKKLVFAPGTYNVSSLGTFAGLSNVTVDLTAATIRVHAISLGAWFRFCSSVEVYGGKFLFPASKFQDPATRFRYPGQSGISISCCQHVEFRGTELWDTFDFGYAISGGDSTTGVWSSEISLVDVVVGNGLGDGIHFTTSTRNSRVSGARIIDPQDDALAVVDDYNLATKRPNNIVFEDCMVDGGIYRGCVAIGADNIVFKNIRGIGTHGPFCWAATDGGLTAPSKVSFVNISGLELGNTARSASDTNSGVGITAGSMSGLILRDLTFTQHSSIVGLGNAIFSVNESTITNYDYDGQYVESIGTTATLTGALDANLSCAAGNGFASVTLPPGRWLVQGTIAARSSTGASGAIYPVFYDGTTEYGRGATQTAVDGATRHQLSCSAVVTTNGGIANLYFRVKNGGGGFTIDAGSTFGPNSYIVATRLA